MIQNKRASIYFKSFMWYILLFTLCLLIEGGEGYGARDMVMSLANSFTVCGAVFFGIGGISYVSYRGGYDTIAYALSLYVFPRVYGKREREKYKDLYEYKAERDRSGRVWLPSALIIGAASIVLGGVFSFLYLGMQPVS